MADLIGGKPGAPV